MNPIPMRTVTLALLTLSGIALGSLAPGAAAAASCHWNDREGGVVYTIEHNFNGAIDFRDGSPCTVVVHPGKAIEYVDGILPDGGSANPLGCIENVEWRLFEPGPCPVIVLA